MQQSNDAGSRREPPRDRNKRNRGSEQIDEAPKAVESEAVEVERELSAEDNPSIERAEPLSRSTSPMFED